MGLKGIGKGGGGGLQVRSGLVMKPDKAVRTVQQMAVLCLVSEMGFWVRGSCRTRRPAPSEDTIPLWSVARFGGCVGRAREVPQE